MNRNESSNHFEAFFEYATMGILVTNKNGEITAINPFAIQEFGYSERDLIGEKIERLIPSRFHTRHIVHRGKFSKNPQTRPMGLGMDLYALKKDGTEFPVEVSLGNYFNEGNRFVIAFINDISVRKAAEAKVEKLNNELEETVAQRTRDLQETLHQLNISKDKLQDVLSYQKALLDNAGALIIATDVNGIIKLFNPEASRLTGYSESEVIDKATPLLFHDQSEVEKKRIKLESEFGLKFTNDFAVLVEKSRRNIHEEEQYTYITKSGDSFPVSLTITSIRDVTGEITGFMGIAIDISKRIKAEEDLRESLEKEKELNELKSRFVSMASHEFRTPLSTVLSSAYLIEKYRVIEDQPQREKHLQRIISSVSMLTDILNDFLSVGKIEEGKIQVRITEFDIEQQLTLILSEIKHILKDRQKVQYVHEGSSLVFLDSSLLKHIVMNLISNASKFSPEDGAIEIKTIHNEQHIYLSVKDHGIGISKDDQKHLMERFFRGTNAGHIQGTGLGLHIISKYAELMNGAVQCISELEKGTEFVITFNTKKV
ncbi:sensor histidine kinase [Daejeonella oryzae]|uniref:sensor histidine kinase n=1 Tax=Daejeonella oryzae TaxID=1122943 RepID=UPI000688FD7D|nr:PAS domain S-box protein [Daejeonella oryzae]